MPGCFARFAAKNIDVSHRPRHLSGPLTNQLMAKDFTGATQSRAGYAVRNVKWNSIAGAYLGEVADPLRETEKRPFTTAMWGKSGKCKNQLRVDIDLVLPQ